jgi:hypothetical protein
MTNRFYYPQLQDGKQKYCSIFSKQSEHCRVPLTSVILVAMQSACTGLDPVGSTMQRHLPGKRTTKHPAPDHSSPDCFPQSSGFSTSCAIV